MKKITKKPQKPQLEFKCMFCKTQWLDDDWKVSEKPDKFGGMIFYAVSKVEYECSTCPTCGARSFDKIEKQEE